MLRCLAVLAAGLLLAACATDSREAFHIELQKQFYYVEQPGIDHLRAQASGVIVGDCDDYALAAWIRSGKACEPWVVRLHSGEFHMVCRWSDGYYADNRTPFGSRDQGRYQWLMKMPTRTIPVVIR